MISDLKIPKIDTLIGIALFGSYGTEYWRKGHSDIDVMVLLEYKKSIGFEFQIEDALVPILEKYFNYNNIHLTFIYMKEFDSSLAKIYIESNNKLIVDEMRNMDFRLYVNKALRNNRYMNSII